jgi:hypothetical protein
MSSCDYEMGRVDERIAVDDLLALVEKTLAERASVDHLLEVLDRIREYRKKTETCRDKARKAGFFGTVDG